MLLAFAVSAATLPTQVPPPPGEELLGRVVVDVAVEGVEPESVGGIEGLDGEPLTRALVQRLIDALWATDRYCDVRVYAQAVAGGVQLVVRLDERRRIRALDAVGNDHLDLHELRRVAGFVPDAEEHPDLLEEMRGRIETAYATHGYPNATVTFHSEEAGEPGRVLLVAEVTEGEPIRIAVVRLAGALLYPEPLLRSIVDIDPGDPWDQPELTRAAARLAEFYRAEGYLLVVVDEPTAEPRDAGRVDVTVTADPGLPVRVVFGGQAHVAPAKLAELAAIDETFDFSPTAVGDAAERIAAYYRTLGFPDAEVSFDVVTARPAEPPPRTPFEEPAAWSAGLATLDPFGDWRGTGRAAPADDMVWFLRFRVHEGTRLGVARIAWDGVTAFETSELDAMVEENVAVAMDRGGSLFESPRPGELGVLGLSGEGWLEDRRAAAPFLADWGPERVFLEQSYRDAAVRVEERYRSEGFLDAHVTALAATRDAAGVVTPRFHVEEGVQSMLAGIAVTGAAEVLEEDVRDVFLLEEGDPVNELLVEETRQAILDLYADRGHLFAQVERQVAFSADRSAVSLTFAVVEGPQVRVAAIEVTGNADTATSLILGSLAFAEGDVFSPDLAQESERRLLRLGIFQGVTISTVAPEVVEAQKTIAVQVREHRPQALELRAGFSTAEGARAALSYGYRNLFGYAIGFNLRLKLNYRLFFLEDDASHSFETTYHALSLQDQLERLLVASLSVPYLPGLRSLVGLQLDLANERKNRPSYGADLSSVFLGVSTGWRKLLSLLVQGGIEYNNLMRFEGDFELCSSTSTIVGCIRPDDLRRLRTPQGTSTFAVVRAAAGIDWRDDPFNPTRGVYFVANAEWVRSFDPVFDASTGVSSFSHLIKTSFQLSGYAPLGAGLVLALAARYGQVFQLERGSRTFPDRYFYLGGSETIRGFPQESLSVADAPSEFPTAGGDLFLIFRGELRVPVGDTFGLAIFSDIGNVWRDPGNLDFTVLRYTAGLGLRIQTPVGPLAFDYGFNLLPRDDWGEGFGALHFSIGGF
ncbi:MAG: BamA/TamA family outer membrane protein [Deltaproteobacteria bacterium]|nr:BamA/TamA family outer membrane protein [Deltaproteobacteria bacterium]